jgi:acetylornithine deacetylase/succinyl-diaminopimelate desuccinylase-like protein
MAYAPESETLQICRDLIRLDTTNYGDDSGPGERKAAEYVAASLDEVGIESELVESEPGRTSLVARWGNPDSSSTTISTSCRRGPATGRSTRSPPRSSTATCSDEAPST